MKFVVACGGTGGHVFPGLAAAQALQSRGHQVIVWLSGKRIEQTLSEQWTGPTEVLNARSFSGGVFGLMLGLRAATAAFFKCRALVRAQRPDALLAMGSYTSLAPVLAARQQRIPVLLHEANAVPGRFTALSAPFVQAVALHFPEAANMLRARQTLYTGMPVRPAITRAASSATGAGVPFTVLVMGGSQGAHRLNELAVDALRLLRADHIPFAVIHLAGAQDAATVARAYDEAGLVHETRAFLSDMGSVYTRASAAVCRAGASTCAELALFGLPSILIPYPFAARQHQSANAAALARAGAAIHIEQNALTTRMLADLLAKWITRPEHLDAMRRAARTRACPDAADRLANALERLAGA